MASIICTHKSKGVHGKNYNCECDVCVASSTPSICKVGCSTFQGLIDMWMSILCPIEISYAFHDLKCLKGECKNCGINMLITCLEEEDWRSEKIMRWKSYEKKFHGKAHSCLDNKVLKFQYKETTTHFFLEYTKLKLQKCVLHNFVACF
jgi:hypothetical protein